MADYNSKWSGADFDSAVEWVKGTLNVATEKIANGAVTLQKLASSVSSAISKSLKAVTLSFTATGGTMTTRTNDNTSISVSIPSATETTAGLMSAEDKQTLDELAEGGGGGGTTDYSALTNKPKIGGVELSGNKSLDDLNVQKKLSSVTEDGSGVTEIKNDSVVLASPDEESYIDMDATGIRFKTEEDGEFKVNGKTIATEDKIVDASTLRGRRCIDLSSIVPNNSASLYSIAKIEDNFYFLVKNYLIKTDSDFNIIYKFSVATNLHTTNLKHWIVRVGTKVYFNCAQITNCFAILDESNMSLKYFQNPEGYQYYGFVYHINGHIIVSPQYLNPKKICFFDLNGNWEKTIEITNGISITDSGISDRYLVYCEQSNEFFDAEGNLLNENTLEFGTQNLFTRVPRDVNAITKIENDYWLASGGQVYGIYFQKISASGSITERSTGVIGNQMYSLSINIGKFIGFDYNSSPSYYPLLTICTAPFSLTNGTGFSWKHIAEFGQIINAMVHDKILYVITTDRKLYIDYDIAN